MSHLSPVARAVARTAVTRAWLAAAPALLIACSSEPQEVVELAIPMRPVTEGAITGVVELSDDTPSLTLETSLAFAVGAGYPARFAAHLPATLYAPCGSLKGAAALREITGDSQAIVAALDGDSSLELEVLGAGVAELVVAGELVLASPSSCALPVGTGIPLEVRIAARALRPASARVERPDRCASASTARVATSAGAEAPGSSADPFELALLDEGGERLFVANAAPDAPIGVRVRGAFDPALAHHPPSSLAEVDFPAVPGDVEIAVELGASLLVEVVDADRVTDVDVVFQLAGTAAGPSVLESGGSYGDGGWNRTANWLAPMVTETRVGEDPLCSPPSQVWFELESSAPEVCDTVPVPPEHASANAKRHTLHGDPTGTAARLISDGTCTLTLQAPGLASGAGIARSLSATFANVDELTD